MKIILLLINVLIFNVVFALDFVVNDFKQPAIAGTHSVGDLNGDGLDDIFVSGLVVRKKCYMSPPGGGCNRILIDEGTKILINDGKGLFEEKKQETGIGFYQAGTSPNYGLPPLPKYSIIKDVNNDGHNDILSARGILYINKGDAQFEKGIDLNIEYNTNAVNSINVADIDNDGVVEILSFGRIYKQINNDLQFTLEDNSYIWHPKKNVELVDFNNDGYIDILTYGNDQNIEIQYNNNGEFNGQKLVLEEKESINLITGDVDNDGDADIVLSSGKILRNDSNFDFVVIDNIIDLGSNHDDLDVDSYVPLQLINYNGDEFLDLYVSYHTSDYYISDNRFRYIDFVLINDGNGHFINDSSELLLLIGSYGTKISFTGNFNSDNLMDFIILDSDIVYEERTYLSQELLHKLRKSPITNSERLNLSLNNIGSTNLSIHSTIQYGWNILADFNNDNIEELLIWSAPYSSSLSYLSDIRGPNYKINEIDLFYCDDCYYSNVMPGDFNGDGFDDLSVAINSPQNPDVRRIFYNSPDGFDIENTTDIDLPIYTSYTADFNGDGRDDMIYGGNIYINKGQIFEEFNFTTSALLSTHVEDINNDGFSDIVYLKHPEATINIVYGQSDMSQALSSEIINREVLGIALFDYNNDGLLDIFALENDNQLTILKQNSNNNFSYVRTINFPYSQPIRYFQIADLNNDGNFDVLSMDRSNNTFYIYQQLNNDSFQTIYQDNEFDWQVTIASYIVHDFDGDSLLDILIGSKIMLNRKFAFITGLNYDPSHSGHGFSIENIGAEDQFYTVFYTYGNDGFPEWYADLGLFSEAGEDYWNISDDNMDVVKFNYDYENSETIQLTDGSDIGYLSHDNCSDSYGYINIAYGLGEGHFGLPVERGKWCSQPIVEYYQRPKNNLSGLWWAGTDDSGWGFSIDLVKRETTTEMVVILYYYDGEGKPRWLIGQQSGFEVGQAITLDMDMVKGYPRGATPRALERFAAGTMTFTLNQASQNILNAGTMSMDVTYPGIEAGNWVRDNVPIALFTNPR